ncbi:MAG: FHA domain-containing protein [Anaerolineae bacterium]|nr:FHA domain-containing protein [Anaerolineae bacterium]
MIILKWHYNDELHKEAFGKERPITIGRSNSADIVLEGNAQVSRSHASLYYKDNQLHILNLSKKNPVDVQNSDKHRRLNSDDDAVLEEGAIFRIGPAQFQVVSLEPEPHDGELMVQCPKCGRYWPASKLDCPIDGWSLANARTVRWPLEQ